MYTIDIDVEHDTVTTLFDKVTAKYPEVDFPDRQAMAQRFYNKAHGLGPKRVDPLRKLTDKELAGKVKVSPDDDPVELTDRVLAENPGMTFADAQAAAQSLLKGARAVSRALYDRAHPDTSMDEIDALVEKFQAVGLELPDAQIAAQKVRAEKHKTEQLAWMRSEAQPKNLSHEQIANHLERKYGVSEYDACERATVLLNETRNDVRRISDADKRELDFNDRLLRARVANGA